ncbi:ribosome maturation factor RimM [Natronospora cellulosivora (SeqCode)]
MNEKFIDIGKITKNQGNKGELRVLPLTDFPERYENLEEVYLSKDDLFFKKQIESIRYHKNFVIVKFHDVNNIGQALEYRDFIIQIPETELLPLEEDELYIDDIIGYRFYTEDGEFLGELRDVLSTGGTDVFMVSGESKDYMIPAAREIIIEVDNDEEKMLIKVIPGLLDL